MAITWEPQIIPIDVDGRIARLVGVATDDADGRTYTVSLGKALIDNPANELAALDRLWAKFVVKYTQQQQINTWIAGKEAVMKTNLDGRSLA